MNHRRNGHAGTLLQSGKVLVTGGTPGGSAELYDPTTRTWTDTDSLGTTRWYHTATLLPNGQVLVAGGAGAGVGGCTGAVGSAGVSGPWDVEWRRTGRRTVR